MKKISPSKKTPIIKVPWYRTLFYGIGAPILQICSTAQGFFLNIFLLEVARISPVGVAAIQFSGRVWDAVTDPLAGLLISKTTTMFGKFKPWMMASTPLVSISFILLFYAPINVVGWEEWEKVLYYLLCVLVLQTALTFYHTPFTAMCMSIAITREQRNAITSLRMSFEVLGILIGAGVFGSIALRNRVAGFEGNITREMYEKERSDYFYAGIIIGVICLLCGVTVIIGSKEIHSVDESKHPYFRGIKQILKFNPYKYLMTTFLCTSLGIQLVQNNLALYITHSLKLPGEVTKSILAFITVSLFNFPFGHLLIRFYSKRKIYYAGIIGYIPLLIMYPLLPPKQVILLYVMLISVSFSMMVSVLIPWSLLPDIIEMFYIKHGFRLEAAFYSFYVFFNKCAVGLSIALNGVALKHANYDASLTKQNKSVDYVLRFYTCAVATSCVLLALVLLYFVNEDQSGVENSSTQSIAEVVERNVVK